MNFAKYIVSHILAKFKYLAKQRYSLILQLARFKKYSTCLLCTSLILIKISKMGPNEPFRENRL